VLPTLPGGPRHRVLIVDRSEDSREVLRAALERRGIQILEATGARQGAALAEQHHPAVIILDSDSEAAEDVQVRAQFDAASREHQTAVVVLGRTRRVERPAPHEQFVAKPYHYAPLIRTIEQLLITARAS
jgi:DNA-binding NtrC family response regulator